MQNLIIKTIQIWAEHEEEEKQEEGEKETHRYISDLPYSNQ